VEHFRKIRRDNIFGHIVKKNEFKLLRDFHPSLEIILAIDTSLVAPNTILNKSPHTEPF
jgi:hypothetical protein